MISPPHLALDHPPLGLAIVIVEMPRIEQPNFRRIDSGKVLSLVRILQVAGKTGGVRAGYYVSDDISEPGTEPLFLIDTTSSTFLATCYVTDGKNIWHLVRHCPIGPNTPTIGEYAYRIIKSRNSYWEMTQRSMDKVLYMIKRYAEGLE